MAASPTDALDLLRFLALSLEVHTDALCCAVDDVEAAIVESSIHDEEMDRLEEELAGLLDRQRRLHAGQAVIALSRRERERSTELRRASQQPQLQPCEKKRFQSSRSHSCAGSTTAGPQSLGRSPRQTVEADRRRATDSADDESVRCLSTARASLDADVASVDRQVDLHKARIEELDCYSLRGKLLRLGKAKKAAKDVNFEKLVQHTTESFEFAPAVRALWTLEESSSNAKNGLPPAAAAVSNAASSPSAVLHGAPSRGVQPQDRSDVDLARYAAGRGNVVNHTNVDLLLARACQRLAGRSVDALDALASTNVSEESPAAHVLGCAVYAAEFDRSEQRELRAVMELQTMPRDALARSYRRWWRKCICTAKLDARCFGARNTVLAAQDFSALPADWTTTKSLSQIPLDEVLSPIRHLLSPRFTFASVAELKQLQAKRVELQRKIVQFLLGGPEVHGELLRHISGDEATRAVASARLAVAESTPSTVSGHAWKTMVRVPHDS